jgi:hypothetical protein
LSWGRLTFADSTRETSIVLTNRPAVFPPSVRVVSRSGADVRISPRSESIADGGPDVLVGALPLITIDASGDPGIEYLHLDPPAPFSPTTVEAMWSELTTSGLPIPTGVEDQGVVSTGALEGLRMVGIQPEVLPVAHSAARSLLIKWPTVESSRSILRPIEIPRGREDERATEHAAARFPSLSVGADSPRPSVSVRTIADDRPWASDSLRHAAAQVVRRLQQIDPPVPQQLVEPFARVARAGTGRAVADPPVSSWPKAGLDCWLLMRACLAGSAFDPAQRFPAPICHLWRLYEAWLAVRVLAALAADPRVALRPTQPASAGGADWVQELDGPHGRILVAAQPRIDGDGFACRSLKGINLCSVSSTLIPDLLIAVERPDSGWKIFVYDAKKRTNAMDARDIAEAASKYAWGLRWQGQDLLVAVSRVTILATVSAGSMFHERSLIEARRVLPAPGVDAVLDLLVDNVLSDE